MKKTIWNAIAVGLISYLSFSSVVFAEYTAPNNKHTLKKVTLPNNKHTSKKLTTPDNKRALKKHTTRDNKRVLRCHH